MVQPTKTEVKEKEQKHIRVALKTCGYPNGTFDKTSKRSMADREEMEQRNNIVMPYVTEYLRNSRGSSTNIISLFTSNLPTHWGKKLSTLRRH